MNAKLTPEEEQRLLGGGKPAPVAAPDAKKQLAEKQDELKKRAKAESDPKKAIDLYTQAIDTDPYAPGARDALLERAKLNQAQNKLEAAQADLFRLKRRPDISEIQSDVDAMLADIAKALQKQAPPEQPANP